MARKPGRFVSLVVTTLLVGSVVGAPELHAQEERGVPPSGFLGDYSELERHPEDKDMLLYRVRDGVLADYDRFLIDPVLVYFHPEAKGVGVDPRKLAELAEVAENALYEQLVKGGYEVVSEPGPGVARIRVAITDVNVAQPGANVALKAAATAAGGVGVLVPSVDVGGATMEVEILDAETGERLVAVVDADRGRRFFNLRSLKKMGDAKAAFNRWAKTLRKKLDQVHRRP